MDGTTGLLLAWVVVAAALWVGLWHSRAALPKWLLSPLVAAVLTLLGALLAGAVRELLSRGIGVSNTSGAATIVSVFCLLVTGYVGGRSLGAARAADEYKRGSRLEDGASAQRRTTQLKRRNAHLLTLAGVAIEPQDETKHFKLIGTTGTGKSTAIRELMAGALARGDRAIIADPDGGYRTRFLDRRRGDVVLNPFEGASLRWDPFAEIREPYDVEQLASALIPPGEDAAAREWRAYARTFLAAVIRRCFQSGVRDSAELWRLLAVASADELVPVVAGSAAQPFLEPENARMFGSIRSVTVSTVAALEYVQGQQAAPFSVRDWVDGGSGVLFIPYQAGQIAALRSLIAAWMRLAIFEALNRTAVERRLWFVVDELDALGAIDGLKDALARLRKSGGRCVLGFQSIAQVSGTYGSGDAQTIVENCGNTLILRCSGSEGGGTSRFASRLIGEREILRRQVSRGHSGRGVLAPAASRRSMNITEQHVTEVAVMPSELEQLPDLVGYLKLASRPVWLRVSLTLATGG
jgi:type IV secretory pathway TraG/TraD family ATPase VirD4